MKESVLSTELVTAVTSMRTANECVLTHFRQVNGEFADMEDYDVFTKAQKSIIETTKVLGELATEELVQYVIS